jgi:transcriptional regulator with XRE-family HTH domain
MASSRFGERFPKREARATKLLAANVRRLRKAKKMTQENLAAAVQVDQQAISLIENGRSNPAILLLDAIASVLGAEMVDLFDPKTRVGRSSQNDEASRSARKRRTKV